MKSNASTRSPGALQLPRAHWLPFLALVAAAVLLVVMYPAGGEAATAPTLGTAASYSVLANTTVTNTGATTLSGDLGIYAGSGAAPHYTGFPPGVVLPPSVIHDADANALQAQSDNTSAFGQLDQPCDLTYGGNQDLTLVSPLEAGVYCAVAFSLSDHLTLSGSGVWIFKSASTLITSPNASVSGGDPCSIWWRVGSSATLDTATTFEGNILALASITMNTGATINGRLLAQTGAVTLQSNIISGPNCVSPSTNTPTPTSTGAPSTSTAVPTSTNTPLPGATNTPVPTSTLLPASTNTPVPGSTNTPVPTSTLIPTSTNTPLPGSTNTPVLTSTLIARATSTSFLPRTNTATPVRTNTATATRTSTVQANLVNTSTSVPTRTPVINFNNLSTATPVPTSTPVATATAMAANNETFSSPSTSSSAVGSPPQAPVMQVLQNAANMTSGSALPAQSPVFLPPNAGDAGLVQLTRSEKPAGAKILLLVVMGAAGIWMLVPRRRKA